MGVLWFVLAAGCVALGVVLLWLDRRRARPAPPDEPEPAPGALFEESHPPEHR